MASTHASPDPLIAIVTPVYNGARYLAETMACVQAQTYTNLVHVVLDNASTDATPDIIRQFQDKRVPVLTARNPALLPVCENWNRALSLMPADAKYFRLLCADDLMAPEAAARMARLLESDPAVGIVAAAEMEGSALEGYSWPPGEIHDGLAVIAAVFQNKAPVVASQCMFRREFYERRAPNFYDTALVTTDFDAMCAVMRQCKVGYVREPSVFTRMHAQTISARELSGDKMQFPEWLVAMHRYGGDAMGEAAAQRLARTFKRSYFRKLLRWQLLDRRTKLVARHMATLQMAGGRPSLLDFADAALDWPLKQIGLTPRWTGYPY